MISGNREQRRAAAKYLQEQNARWPAQLIDVPAHEWPPRAPARLVAVKRSRSYLVQVFDDGASGVLVRLSINRCGLTPAGGWLQEIAWDDLQRLKAEAGYADFDAVEVFPRAADVVNVANMRHLWVMSEPLAFAWREK